MKWVPAKLRRACATFALLALIVNVQAATDPGTGLVIDPGWQAVRAHCGGCHSYRLVTSQRGDAAYWRALIRWMQRTQNLWQIPEPQESELIEYLARNYAEDDWGRRPPLARDLRPPPVSR